MEWDKTVWVSVMIALSVLVTYSNAIKLTTRGAKVVVLNDQGFFTSSSLTFKLRTCRQVDLLLATTRRNVEKRADFTFRINVGVSQSDEKTTVLYSRKPQMTLLQAWSLCDRPLWLTVTVYQGHLTISKSCNSRNIFKYQMDISAPITYAGISSSGEASWEIAKKPECPKPEKVEKPDVKKPGFFQLRSLRLKTKGSSKQLVDYGFIRERVQSLKLKVRACDVAVVILCKTRKLFISETYTITLNERIVSVNKTITRVRRCEHGKCSTLGILAPHGHLDICKQASTFYVTVSKGVFSVGYKCDSKSGKSWKADNLDKPFVGIYSKSKEKATDWIVMKSPCATSYSLSAPPPKMTRLMTQGNNNVIYLKDKGVPASSSLMFQVLTCNHADLLLATTDAKLRSRNAEYTLRVNAGQTGKRETYLYADGSESQLTLEQSRSLCQKPPWLMLTFDEGNLTISERCSPHKFRWPMDVNDTIMHVGVLSDTKAGWLIANMTKCPRKGSTNRRRNGANTKQGLFKLKSIHLKPSAHGRELNEHGFDLIHTTSLQLRLNTCDETTILISKPGAALVNATYKIVINEYNKENKRRLTDIHFCKTFACESVFKETPNMSAQYCTQTISYFIGLQQGMLGFGYSCEHDPGRSWRIKNPFDTMSIRIESQVQSQKRPWKITVNDCITNNTTQKRDGLGVDISNVVRKEHRNKSGDTKDLHINLDMNKTEVTNSPTTRDKFIGESSTRQVMSSVMRYDYSTDRYDPSDRYDTSTGRYDSSTGRYDSSTGRYDSSTGRYDSSTVRYDPSTGRYDSSTVRYDPSTGRYDTSTGRYDSSTGRYDSSTGRYDSSTDRYDTSTGRYDSSTGRYDSSTVRYDPSTGRYDQSSGRYDAPNDRYHTSTDKYDATNIRYDATTVRYDRSAGRNDVSIGRYEASTGRYDASIGRYEASTGRYDASIGRNDASTGRYDASTGRYDESIGRNDAFTGRYDASTGKYDASTGKFDASTARYDASISRYDPSSGTYDHTLTESPRLPETATRTPGDRKQIDDVPSGLKSNKKADKETNASALTTPHNVEKKSSTNYETTAEYKSHGMPTTVPNDTSDIRTQGFKETSTRMPDNVKQGETSEQADTSHTGDGPDKRKLSTSAPVSKSVSPSLHRGIHASSIVTNTLAAITDVDTPTTEQTHTFEKDTPLSDTTLTNINSYEKSSAQKGRITSDLTALAAMLNGKGSLEAKTQLAPENDTQKTTQGRIAAEDDRSNDVATMQDTQSSTPSVNGNTVKLNVDRPKLEPSMATESSMNTASVVKSPPLNADGKKSVTSNPTEPDSEIGLGKTVTSVVKSPSRNAAWEMNASFTVGPSTIKPHSEIGSEKNVISPSLNPDGIRTMTASVGPSAVGATAETGFKTTASHPVKDSGSVNDTTQSNTTKNISTKSSVDAISDVLTKHHTNPATVKYMTGIHRQILKSSSSAEGSAVPRGKEEVTNRAYGDVKEARLLTTPRTSSVSSVFASGADAASVTTHSPSSQADTNATRNEQLEREEPPHRNTTIMQTVDKKTPRSDGCDVCVNFFIMSVLIVHLKNLNTF